MGRAVRKGAGECFCMCVLEEEREVCADVWVWIASEREQVSVLLPVCIRRGRGGVCSCVGVDLGVGMDAAVAAYPGGHLLRI